MAFINQADFDHSEAGKVGVLITNLGTPSAPTAKAVRSFLREFLSDQRVVEIPRLIWFLILNLFVLPLRPRRAAEAYAKIWTEEGSPLLVHTQHQLEALRVEMTRNCGDMVVVEYAMRYGQPSIASGLQSLIDAGARRLLVLPLFPQYSASTGASTYDAIAANLRQRRWLPDLRMITHYHDEPGYIEALANSVRNFQKEHGEPEMLVMSFHGLPRRFLEQGDPYYCECQKTGRLLAEQLELNNDQYIICYQSRFGAAQWLEPYTDVTLRELAESGVRNVQAICPGFSADCLETLEEIAIANREEFLSVGGEIYEYIPALNAGRSHIEFLAALIKDNLHGWLDEPGAAARSSQLRAQALGAAC